MNNSNLNINVVGLGFVGLVTAAVFAKKGFYINGVEKDSKRLKNIKKGVIDFYEPNLVKNITIYKKKLNFCSDIVINKNKLNVLFLCVGTPSKKNGDIDLKYINKFCKNLKKNKKDKILLIIKSTVLPGTLNNLILKYFKNNNNILFCSNPEFLQEGTAFKDFINSEKIVVGNNDDKTKKILVYLYKKFNSKFIFTNFTTAEFIKYLSNNLLASLISFSNFMKILSYEIKGLELKKSFDAVKLDKRWFGNPANISKYLHPGIGYGGSCLPKDVSAFEFFVSKKLGNNNILKNYMNINSSITEIVIKKSITKMTKLNKKKVIFLGASFKAGSDDIRNSKSIDYIKRFIELKNINYSIYDEKVKKINLNGKEIKVSNNKVRFDKDNFYILLTEWKSYISFLKKIPENSYFDTREVI